MHDYELNSREMYKSFAVSDFQVLAWVHFSTSSTTARIVARSVRAALRVCQYDNA
jgi:hypothetical protein